MWRNACGNEQYLGKSKRLLDLGGETQMAVVNRVERTAEETYHKKCAREWFDTRSRACLFTWKRGSTFANATI